MAEEWFVRVEGKEYGPVDLDDLLEWKAEGRLIRDNEVRTEEEVGWRRAEDVAELFAAPPPLPQEPENLFRRRTLPEILRHAFAIYRIGFRVFLPLSLLVALPAFLFKLSLAYVRLQPETGFGGSPPAAIAGALLMLPLILAAWFVFVAGLQFTSVDILAGRAPDFTAVLQRVKGVVGVVARVGVVVYGSYAFWTMLPLLAIVIVAGGGPSAGGFFIVLFALAFQVFMVGRLFINFLFWQQACTIGRLDPVESLRESRDLARSNGAAPRLERPLYRGAILASIWLLVLLAVNMVIELPFLASRLQGVTSVEQVMAVNEALRNATGPDGLTLATFVLSTLAHALLRPLLGIAFVLLYLDAKARAR
ncbi:hypothetical protein BH20VER1_BH20VER1_27180 [soil metagenome]